MLNDQLKEKLQRKLVDVTCMIETQKSDKKLQMAAISELIKTLEKRQNIMSRAIKNDDEELLIQMYGEFYAEELGVK